MALVARRVAYVGLLVALVALPAAAKEGGKGGGDAKFQACQADFDRLCKDVKPGDGRIMACMTSNVDRLSEGCAQVMREKAQQEKEWRERKAGKGK